MFTMKIHIYKSTMISRSGLDPPPPCLLLLSSHFHFVLCFSCESYPTVTNVYLSVRLISKPLRKHKSFIHFATFQLSQIS